MNSAPIVNGQPVYVTSRPPQPMIYAVPPKHHVVRVLQIGQRVLRIDNAVRDPDGLTTRATSPRTRRLGCRRDAVQSNADAAATTDYLPTAACFAATGLNNLFGFL